MNTDKLVERGAKMNQTEATTDDLINGLRRMSDDHPYCAATIAAVIERLREMDQRYAQAVYALQVAWYAMEKHAPELCGREIATSRAVLKRIGSLLTDDELPRFVYLVTYQHDYEGECIEAVYSTHELAEQHSAGGEGKLIHKLPLFTFL